MFYKFHLMNFGEIVKVKEKQSLQSEPFFLMPVNLKKATYL